MNVSNFALSSLNELPSTLEYQGEFGRELLLFLPFIRWLSAAELLTNRSVLTYKGMRTYYEGLKLHDYAEKNVPRVHVPHELMPSWLPWTNEHRFDGRIPSPFLVFGDERSRCRTLDLARELGSADKPLLIIHNKNCNEWSKGPINTISCEQLDELLNVLEKDHTIVYVRHGYYSDDTAFAHDHNDLVAFDESDVLRKHPNVLEFHEAFSAERKAGGLDDLNAFKTAIYSRCWRFVSVQGGGAHQIACFSGSLVVILHIAGSDINLSYNYGLYSVLANPAPIRLVCSTPIELAEACTVFQGATVVDGRILVASTGVESVRKFSPFRFAR